MTHTEPNTEPGRVLDFETRRLIDATCRNLGVPVLPRKDESQTEQAATAAEQEQASADERASDCAAIVIPHESFTPALDDPNRARTNLPYKPAPWRAEGKGRDRKDRGPWWERGSAGTSRRGGVR